MVCSVVSVTIGWSKEHRLKCRICPQKTRFTLNQTKEINFVMWHHVVLPVIPFSLSTAWVWIHAYQNILFTQAFWQALLWPWIILCSPLRPSRHNHTCLILSNLSFILANQLLRCALFHHLLSCDSIIFSLIPTPQPPQPPALTPYTLFFSIFILLCFPCHGIRVNLDPSKRQGSNKSVSGCTLPQGSKTVSKFPCLSLLFLSACAAPSVCLVTREYFSSPWMPADFFHTSIYELLLVCMTCQSSSYCQGPTHLLSSMVAQRNIHLSLFLLFSFRIDVI